eukprot:15366351-Ditylum_brightwellii.AAC.3
MSINPPPETTPDGWDPYDEYEDDNEIAWSLPEMKETVDANGTLIDQQPVDFEGFTTTMMEGIIDNERDEKTTAHMKDKCVRTYSNQRRPRNSTKGWKLQILWKDKSES